MKLFPIIDPTGTWLPKMLIIALLLYLTVIFVAVKFFNVPL